MSVAERKPWPIATVHATWPALGDREYPAFRPWELRFNVEFLTQAGVLTYVEYKPFPPLPPDSASLRLCGSSSPVPNTTAGRRPAAND